MQVVVLGAGGSLGNAVARRAALGGHQVRAVVRDPTKRLGLPPFVETHRADLLDGTAVQRACDGADVVIHAANVPYPDWPRLVPRLAENALSAAEAVGAVLAFPGNVYVYGRPKSRPVTEDHPMEPHTAKGRIRLGIERAYLQAHREGRARVAIARFPDFYGPRISHEFLRPIFEGALSGSSCMWPIDADAPHEFIYIDDAADGLLRVIGVPAAHGKAVHVPGPGIITARDFTGLAYRMGGHEPMIRVYGRGTWRIVGLFNRLARAAFEMSYLFDEPVILDGSMYRSLIGAPHPSTPYEEGIRRTLEWFRTHRNAE